MSSDGLDRLPLWMFFALATATALLSLEVGYRAGSWRYSHMAGEKEAPTGAMVGAMLGLLAFMLAFTFGMAASRFDSRRMTILEEANAIGTTYLRTSFLSEPERAEIAGLLRDYVDLRIRAVQEGDLAAGIKQSEELHGQIWPRAVKAADRNPESIMAGLFIQSLNDMIDLHSKRVLIGARSRIPGSIWIALFGLAIICMVSMGYQAGLSTTRRSPAAVLFAVAFAGILFLIVDLDRAHEGMLRVSQQAMLDLQQSMRASQP